MSLSFILFAYTYIYISSEKSCSPTPLTTIYFFIGNNKNTRAKGKICSKLTTKTPKQCHWHHSCFFFYFAQISPIALVFHCWLWTSNFQLSTQSVYRSIITRDNHLFFSTFCSVNSYTNKQKVMKDLRCENSSLSASYKLKFL